MSANPSSGKLFNRNPGNQNTVLNWHDHPENELRLYGEAFWNAAKKLMKNDRLDRAPGACFDAAVIVYLYRHALELFLKEIVIGRGADLISDAPSPTKVTVSHSLTKLIPHVRKIFAECGWDKEFGTNHVPSFDDFIALLQEFESADPASFSFRYPIKKDLTKSLNTHFTFSVLQFAEIMDEILENLSTACFGLSEIADARAETAYEAQQEEMEYAERPDPDYE